MALSPKPVVPPQVRTAAEIAAHDARLAKQLEQHVDLWLKGQGAKLEPGAPVDVSIGEHQRWSAAVLELLVEAYRAAGWTESTATDDPAKGAVLHLVPAAAAPATATPDVTVVTR